MWPFRRRVPRPPPPMPAIVHNEGGGGPAFVLMEGVGGRWHYHLAQTGFRNAQGSRAALCGATDIMDSPAPLSTWNWPGWPDGVKHTYCKACNAIAPALGVPLLPIRPGARPLT
jgi:hypothetical protein